MSPTRVFGSFVLAFWLLASSGATGREQSLDIGQVKWRILGPGVCGANFAIGFHAGNPKIMLGGTDMGAAYRTDDSGKSWRIVGSQKEGESQPGCSFGVWRATFDPKRPRIAWLGSQFGAHKSIDGGLTWKRVTASITGQPMMVQCIGIDPTDSDIVYIGQGWAPRSVQSWVRGRVWKTLDDGTTWEELARPGGPVDDDALKARSYTNIIVDPNGPFRKGRGHARVRIFGRGGLFVSDTAGTTWTSLSGNLPRPEVDDMVLVDNGGHSTLFTTIHAWLTDDESRSPAAGVYRSDDNGRSW
ncbi:MAG TPA: hypothetical protein VMY37_06865 [Thermoguttaceae bacterium]|nr:hypothetical protein [Thermoguttaceae bacterium]